MYGYGYGHGYGYAYAYGYAYGYVYVCAYVYVRALEFGGGAYGAGECRRLGGRWRGSLGAARFFFLRFPPLVKDLPQVCLASYEKQRHARLMVLQLRPPFRLDIHKRGTADDRVADKEDVRLRVRERAQPVIIRLPGGVPQAEVDRPSVDHDVRAVIFKDGRHIVLPGRRQRTRARVREGA